MALNYLQKIYIYFKVCFFSPEGEDQHTHIRVGVQNVLERKLQVTLHNKTAREKLLGRRRVRESFKCSRYPNISSDKCHLQNKLGRRLCLHFGAPLSSNNKPHTRTKGCHLPRILLNSIKSHARGLMLPQMRQAIRRRAYEYNSLDQKKRTRKRRRVLT